ncbi:MAG: CHASE3 domain-containing protein [Gemmataceae bacterium]
MNLPNKGLLLVSIPLLAQLVFLGVLALTRKSQREALEWATHSTEVIARAEAAHRLLVETQTHMRGYALAPAETFVVAYNEARPRVPSAFDKLHQLVEDNVEQRERVAAMQELAGRFLAWMDENVRLLGQGHRQDVQRRIASMSGANYLRDLRGVIDEFLGVEKRLDRKRREDLEVVMRTQDLALLAGCGLALVSTAALLVAFSRSISSRVGVLIDNTRRLGEGRELAARLTGHDELGELDEMFHRMAEALRQKEQENELFVYSVSHDLRSPLVNLQGFSQELSVVVRDLRQLILESGLPEARKDQARRLIERDAGEAIGFIQSAVTRLASIIDALLRLSRAGRVEYRPQLVEVHATINRVVQAMNDTLARKGAEVAVHPLPPCWGDPTAVEQIFANLIGNAANYLDPSRPGKIEVGVVEGETGSFTTYFVKDNGLGIPEDLQPKVFIAFQRLHPSVAKGEGIGLALVRRVVERHGGRIWLESQPGVGTTFFVALPASREALPLDRPSASPIPVRATRT